MLELSCRISGNELGVLGFFKQACSMVGDICPAIDTTSTKLLIRGGIVVNADRQQIADVYIEDGIIVAIEPNIKV